MIPIHSYICPFCNFINENKNKKHKQNKDNVNSLIDQLKKGDTLNKKNLQVLKTFYLNQFFEKGFFVQRDQFPR